MARITVEDCIDKFPSRFELVLVASNRARKLYSGENSTVDTDNDKNTVVALREIAEETLTTEQLKNDLIQEYQTNTFSEDEDLEEIEDLNSESQTNENNVTDIEALQNNENDVEPQNESSDQVTDESSDQVIDETADQTSKDNLSDENKVQDLL